MQQHTIFDHQPSPTTPVLVNRIKQHEQDFEWYPTTDEIIATIKADLEEQHYGEPTVLDCGAGDGRVLEALTNNTRYAIEKARPLLQAMDRSIYLVGTEFNEQTLLDKRCDVIFSNPPYKHYAHWMQRIIKEGNAGFLYFVVPTRWEDNPQTQAALKLRRAEAHTLGQFDFLQAERQARAKVSIVRVDLASKHRNRHHSNAKTDPFELWFEECFALDVSKTESSKFDYKSDLKESVGSHLKGELVAGGDVVSSLEKLYQRDLNKLMANYQALSDIDPALLRELDVNIEGVQGALKQKIESLKDCYWNELFSNLEAITSRLTHAARTKMLEKLNRHIHVDFTSSNARAIIIWAIKNCNNYFDDQLIDLVKTMTEQANIILYKSNQRTFRDDQWRYCRTPEGLDRYALDYRCVISGTGGISTSCYSWENSRHNGLAERAYHFINDILTVANNLNFDTSKSPTTGSFEWQSNKANTFTFTDHHTGQETELFQTRAFKNGNLQRVGRDSRQIRQNAIKLMI
tara:strand:- start:8229 stop:9779 length:1551 start_codon:yes stop_codon:yes gene_type:complete